MPEHSDDPGCADLTDSQECVPEGTSHPRGRDLAIPLPEDVGRPAGPTEAAAAEAWISGEHIAAGQVPSQLNPAIVDCLRRSGEPGPHLRLPRGMTWDT